MSKGKKRTIIKSTILITVFTVIIKILGLVKQTAISAYCGASFATDAFNISTGIFGQIASLIFSGIAVVALTMYINIKENKGDSEAFCFLKTTLISFIPIAAIISFIVFIFSRNIAIFLAPSYSKNNILLLSNYIKIVSFSFIPWCIYLILNVSLEAEKRFIPGRCQALFQNLFLILAALLCVNRFGIVSLVYAFLLSGIIQCALILILNLKKIIKFRLKNYNLSEVKKLLFLALPLVIGNATSEINDIVDKKIATQIGEGIPSLLTYSATLNEIITGVVISSLSIVLFVHFSDMVAKKEIKKLEMLLRKSVLFLTFMLIPITIIFSISGLNIVKVVYGRGMITNNNIKIINTLLLGYSLGFIFQATRIIYAKALYAFQNTKAPLINGIVSIIVNAVLSVFLTQKFGYIGISISTSISMFIATILLHYSLKKYLPSFSFKTDIKELIKMLFAGCFSSVIIFSVNSALNMYIASDLLIIFIQVILCIGIYLLSLYLLKSNILNEFISLATSYITTKKIKEV